MEYEVKKIETVFISGQKYFAQEVLRLCLDLGLNVAGVCAPFTDKYLKRLAVINNIPVIEAGTLNGDNMPEGVCLGIAAHSFDYVGRRTRLKTRLGWLGFHPSLLPRHRGRSAIEWALRMKDPITGGSTYWLNSGVDRGDVFLQNWFFIDPVLTTGGYKKNASKVWRENMLPVGLKVMRESLELLKGGKCYKIKQDSRFSTFEPNTNVKDIFKPDLLMIPEKLEEYAEA